MKVMRVLGVTYFGNVNILHTVCQYITCVNILHTRYVDILRQICEYVTIYVNILHIPDTSILPATSHAKAKVVVIVSTVSGTFF